MPNIVISANKGLKYLFTQKNGGLCMRSIISGRFREHTPVFPEIRGDFDAAVSQSGKIEIICQDKEHNLILLSENGGNFSKEYILRARENSSINLSSFRLISTNALMTAFYCIDHDGKTMLCRHSLTTGGAPEPIDYLKAGHRSSAVCKTRNGDIHIFYCSEEGGFGKKTYKWSQKSLGEFTPISERADNISVCEHEGINLCITNQNGIFYSKLPYENGAAENMKLLTRQDGNIKSCVIFEENNSLNIMWEISGHIYATSSEDGNSWTRVKEIPNPQNFPCERVKLMNEAEEMYTYCRASNAKINFPSAYRLLNTSANNVPVQNTAAEPKKTSRITNLSGISAEEGRNELIEIQREYFQRKNNPPENAPSAPKAPSAEKTENAKSSPGKSADTPKIPNDDAFVRLAESIEKLAASIREKPSGGGYKSTRRRSRKPALSIMHKKINNF